MNHRLWKPPPRRLRPLGNLFVTQRRAFLAAFLLAGFCESAAQTFYWNRNDVLTYSADFSKTHNWSSNANGSGSRPRSLADDDFTPDALGAVWTPVDLDNDAGTGAASTTANADQLTLTGRGSDVWGPANQFYGVHRGDIAGDFDVTVRIVSLTNTDVAAKTGIIIANNFGSLAAGGYANLGVRPDGTVEFTRDISTNIGELDNFSSTSPNAFPIFLRLVKMGSSLSAFYKTSLGNAWSQVGTASGSQNLRGDIPTQVGLFVCSHNPGSTATAIFDDFQGGTRFAPGTNYDLSFGGSGGGSGSDALITGPVEAASIDLTGYSATLNFGRANGLAATLFDNNDFTGTAVARMDSVVHFNWASGAPHGSIGADDFSIRWEGWLEPQFTETYTFYTAGDDGERLWVNNVLVIDSWVSNPAEVSGTLSLTAGQKVPIRLEYYEGTGTAGAHLLWSSPSTAKATVPNNRLFASRLAVSGNLDFGTTASLVPGQGLIELTGSGAQTLTARASQNLPAIAKLGSGTTTVGGVALLAGPLIVSGGAWNWGSGTLTHDVHSIASSGSSGMSFGTHTVKVSLGNADFSGISSLNPGTGALEFSGASAQTFTPRASVTHPNIVKTGAGTTTVATNSLGTNSLTVSAGTFDGATFEVHSIGNVLVNGGTLAMSSGILDVSGNITVSSGTLILPSGNADLGGNFTQTGGTLLPGSGSLRLSGTAAGKTFTATSSLNNLIVNGSGGSWTLGGNLSAAGALTVTAGVLSTASYTVSAASLAVNGGTLTGGSGTMTVSGNLSLSSGTLSMPSSTLYVGGSVSRTGGTAIPNSGTLRLIGTGTKNVDWSPTLYSLVMDGSGSTWTAVNSGITAANTFQVINGTFNLGSLTHNFERIQSSGGALDFGTSTVNITGNSAYFNGLSALTAGSGTLNLQFASGMGLEAKNGATHPHINKTGAGIMQIFAANLTCLSYSHSGGILDVNGFDLTSSGNLSLTGGTLVLGTRTLTANGNLAVGGGTLSAASGSVDVNGNLSVSSGTLSAPSGTLWVTGNVTKAPGATWTHNSGTLRLDGNATGKTLDISGSLYNLVMDGSGGGWTVTNTGLTLLNQLAVYDGALNLGTGLASTAGFFSSGGTTGTLDFGGSSLHLTGTIGGSNFQSLGTLTAGTGALHFTSNSGVQAFYPKSGATHPHIHHTGSGELELHDNDLTCKSFTQSAGTLDFGGRNITTPSSGDFTLTNGTTASFVNLGGRTLAVGGNASISGTSGANRVNLDGGAAWYLNVTGTASVSLATVQNANSAGFSTVACSNCSNQGANNNWTFATAWDGGGGDAFWSTPANWGGDVVPLSTDDVAFNAGALGAVLDGNVTLKSLTMTSGYSGSFDFGSSTLSISGNADFRSSGGIIANSGTLEFTGSSAQVFIPKPGATFPAIVQSGSAGTGIQTHSLTAASLSVTGGTFSLGSTGPHAFGAVSGGAGGTLLFSTSDLSASGHVDLSTLTVSAGGRVLTLNGSSPQNYTPPTGSSPEIVQNGSGGTTLLGNLSTPYLTLSSGTLNLGSARSHSASALIVNGGGIHFGSSTLNLSGATVDLTNLASLTPGTGTLAFTAASGTQTFTPKSATTHPALSKSGAGTLSIATHDLTAASLALSAGTLGFGTGPRSLTLAGNLDLTGGTLDLSTNAPTLVVGGNLTMPGAGSAFNAANGTLDVNGNFQQTDGTFTAPASNPFTLGGGFSCYNSCSFNPNSGTVTFDATSTGHGMNTGTAFANLVFNGAGGGWTASANIATTGTLTLANGILNVSSGLWISLGGYDQTGGTLTATVADLDIDGNFSHTGGTFTAPGSGRSFLVSGNFTRTGGTFTHNTGRVTLDGTATGKTWNSTGNLFDMTVNGSGGEWTVTPNGFTLLGTLTLTAGVFKLGTVTSTAASFTSTGGTLDFMSGTLRISSGNANLNGLAALTPGSGILQFTAATGMQVFTPKSGASHPALSHTAAGELELSSYDLSCLSFSQTSGVLDFGGRNITTTGGSFSLTNGNSTSLVGLGGRILTVTGNAIFTGSASTNRLNLAPGTAWSLNASGTTTASWVTVDYSNASGSGSAGNCSDCANQGNNSNWNFNVTWDGGGADNNWTTAGNWGSDFVPTSQDAVAFNATSAKDATLDAAATVKSLTFTSGYTGTFSFTSHTLTIDGGGADFRSGGAIDAGTGTLAFTGGGSQSFIPKASTTFPAIHHNSNAGTTTISVNPLTAGVLTLGMGTFHLGASMTHSLGGIAGGGGIDFGTSDLNVTGNVDLASQTVTATTANTLAFTGSSAQTFNPKTSEPDLNLVQNGSGGTTVITNGFTAASLTIATGTFNLGSALQHATSDLVATGGGLDFNAGTLDVSGSTVDLSALAALTPGTGSLRFAGTGAQTFIPKAGATHPGIWKNGSGTTTVSTHGLTAGALTPTAGTFHMGSGLTHSFTGCSPGGGPYGSLDFGGSTVHFSGHVNFTSLPAVTPGTGAMVFDAASGTQIFQPKSGAAHPAITHSGAGTLQLATSNLACAAFSQVAGVLDLNGRNIQTTGGFSVTNGDPSSLANLGGRTLTIGGNASFAGATTASPLNLNPGAAWTLAVSGTLTATRATVDYGTASGSAGACSNCVNAGNNSNWSFAVTWDGGGGDGNWSNVSNWGSDAVPTAIEDVTFNATSLPATLDVAATVKSITFTTGYTGTFSFSSNTLTVNGDADFRSGGAIAAGNGTLAFNGSSAQTFIPKAGATFPNIVRNGSSGTTTVATNPLTAGNLTLSLGTFHLGASMTHTVAAVSGSGALDFGTSNLNATGNVDLSGAAVTASTANTLAFTGASAQTYVPHASVTALNLAQNGAGGTTITTNSFVTPHLTVASGVLSLGAGMNGNTVTTTLTLTGGGLNWGSSNLYVGAALADFSALASSTPATGNLHFNGSSAQTFTPNPSLSFPSIWQSGPGGTTLAADLNASQVQISSGTLNLGTGRTHTVWSLGGSGGTLNFGSSTIRLTSGHATLAPLTAVNAGTGTLAFTGTGSVQQFSVHAGTIHPAIVHSGGSEVELVSNDLACHAFTQTAGTLDLNGRNIATVSGGDFSLSNGNSATLINLGGRSITVAGNASLSGTAAADRLNLDPATAWTLAVAGTLSANFATLKNNTASASAGNCANCANAGSNSNWSFATGWVGTGGDANWTTAANWGSNAVPTAAEDVTFNAGSADATLDASAAVKSITFTTDYAGAFSFSSHTLTVTGNADFRTGGAINANTGMLTFAGSSAQTFIPKSGATFPNITLNGTGGVTLLTNALAAGDLTLTAGTLALGASLAHSVGSISGSGGLDFGTSNLQTQGDADLSSLTLTAASSNVLAFANTTARTFTPNASATGLLLSKTGSGSLAVATNGFTTPSLTLSAGTLTLASGVVHAVNGPLSLTGGGLDFNGGTLRTTAADVDLRSLAALTGTGDLELTGSSAQTLRPRASTLHPNVRQNGSGGTTVASNSLQAVSLIIDAGTLDLGSGFTHDVAEVSTSGGSLAFNSSTLSIAGGNVDLASLATLTPGTGTLRFASASGTQVFTPKASTNHPAVTHTAAGILQLAANDLSCASFTQSAGVLDLGGRNLTTVGAGDFTVTNGHPSSFTGLGGRTLTVAGNAAVTGSDGSIVNLDPATPWTFAVAGSLTATYASLARADASASAGSAVNSADVTGNTHWTFSVSWTGGAADNNWTSSLNWGSGAAPGATTHVLFDATHTKSAVLDAAGSVKSIVFTPGYTGTFAFGANTLTVAAGDADFRSGGAISAGTGTLAFASAGAQAFHPRTGAAFPDILKSGAGTTTVTTHALTAGNLSVTGGVFHLGAGLTHSVADVGGSGALHFGTSNLNATGDVNLSGLAVTATAASTLAFTGGAAQTFTPKASVTDLNLAQNGTGGTTVAVNAFTTPALTLASGTLNLGAGLTHSVADMTVTGGGLDFASSTLRTAAPTVDFTALAALTPGTGVLELTNASAQTLIPRASTTHPALLKSGSGTTTLATRGLAAGALTITGGTLDLGPGFTHVVTSLAATGGALTFQGSTLQVAGNADFSALATLGEGTGTVEFAAASGIQTFTPKASATHPRIAHTGAGTVRLAGNALHCRSYGQTAGSLDFNGLDVTTTLGDFTVTNGTASSFSNLAGRTLTVAAHASFTGQAGNLVNLNPASAWTLAVTGNLNATLSQIANCIASAAPGEAVSSVDGTGNLNWSFSVTWDGGGPDDNWTTGANWSSDVAPGSGTKVVFDATSPKNCVLDGAATVKTLLMASGYTGTFSFATNTLNVTGNADFRSGGAITPGTGTLAFAGASAQSFIPKPGATFPGITQNGAGGTTLSTHPLAAGALNLMNGSFSLGTGFTHAVTAVGGTGGILDFGGSILQASGHVDLSGLSAVNAGTGLLELTGGGAQTLSPKAGATHPRVAKTGTGTATVSGSGLTTAGLRIAAGTLNLGAGLVHEALDSLGATGGTLDFASSTLRAGAVTANLAGLAGLSAGTGTLEFNGSSAQTFTPKAALAHPALVQNGAGGTTVATHGLLAGSITIAQGTLSLGVGLAHTLGGFASTGGGLDFGSSTVSTAGDVNLGGLATLNAGGGILIFTAASGTQVFVPRNGSVHPLLTHPAAGTLQLSGSSLTARGFDQTAGALDLNGFDLTLSASGSLAVSGHALPILGLSGRTLTVTGNAHFAGTPTTRVDLNPGSAWTLAVSGSLTAVNARIRNNVASLAAGVADSSLDLGGNAGWTFVDSIRPDNVSAFLASAAPGNAVALSWTASASGDADSVMLRYRTDGIYPTSRTDGILWGRVKAGESADTAAGLTDKTVYHFAAFVKDSSGNYSPATTASRDSARLPDLTPPANITALSASGISSSAAALAWIPSGTPDADSVMIRYRTGLVPPADPSDGTLWRKLPIAADTDTLTGLAANTLYAFSLFVRDSAGNYSPASAGAQDTSLFQIPVTGTVAFGDVSGRTTDGDPALAFTWSGADSMRFALLADTAAAAWKAVLASDSLGLGAADGQKVVAAQFKNLYGRRSAWVRDTTLLDRKAPVVTLDLEPELGPWTWPVAVSGKSRDSLSGTDRVMVVRRRLVDGYYFNGAAWQAAADTAKLVLSGQDSLFSASLPASAMATGDYQFTAYARDRAGNVGQPLTRAVHYEANRAPSAAYSNISDTLLQNQAAAWKLDYGDLDAGDSLVPISFEAPAWLTAAPGPDTAWAPWALHRTWSLSGTPAQAHVGAHVIRVRLQDRGGLILTHADTVQVLDVNDPPAFADGKAGYTVKEDSVARWKPAFADPDPADRHTLALLSGPAFAQVESLSVVLKPGSRDVGTHPVTLAVGDGELLDTLQTLLTVVNVNDKPYAFASTGFPSPAFFKEDRADSFTVVVVDLDRHEPIVFAGQMPAWMKMTMAVDSTGYNRTFTFRVNPSQQDTGAVSMALTFMDPAQAVTQLALTGRILANNDTPTAVVEDPRTHGGAARFRLSVVDEDGSLEKARFHYRLVRLDRPDGQAGSAADTVRRGITPSSLLSLHPLADGEYRLAVRAEDQDGVVQGAFTVVPFSVAGATTLALDTARWHMLGPQQAALAASVFGAGATLATWDEAGDDGQPLARYTSGKTVETLRRGKGYWVRLARPVTLHASQKELLEGPTSVKLTHAKQGWNQVANPYSYWIDLSASKLTFWEWDAQKRDLVNSRGLLKPWAAYWVLASRDTLLPIADAPYFPSPPGALAKSSSAGSAAAAGGMGASFRHREDWSLQLGLRAGLYHDEANLMGVRSLVAGQNETGAPDAADAASVGAILPGSAARVLPDAPKFGDYIALHFEKPAAEGRPAAAQGYAADFHGGLDPEEEWWDFSVENRGTGETQALLSPAGLEGLAAAGLKLFLVKQGEARLVEPGRDVVLAVEEERTHYSLVVTPHADFAGRLKGNFSLSQNFPNPVNFQTTFRFFLPQSWDKEGKRADRDFKLRINVYDFAGRQVAQAASGSFRPGSHSLVWKPVSRGGGPLAKGAYVYRLEVPGFTKSLKLLVE